MERKKKREGWREEGRKEERNSSKEPTNTIFGGLWCIGQVVHTDPEFFFCRFVYCSGLGKVIQKLF